MKKKTDEEPPVIVISDIKRAGVVGAISADLLSRAMSLDYSTKVADAIAKDVIEDVKASADDAFNYDDVRLAIGRVLCKRLGVES